MSKLIYLSTGQQAFLIETLPNGKFLVDPIFEYEDHEGNVFDDKSGSLRIEDTIFDKAPKAKINAELLQLQEKLKATKEELNKAQTEWNKKQHELVLLKNQTNDATKWVFDLSKFRKAKRIVFFVEDILIPIVVGEKRRNEYWWSLNLSIKLNDAVTAAWLTGYNDGSDSNDYTKSNIDVTRGFYFDITDEEIMNLFLERLDTFTEKPKLHYTHSWDRIPAQYRVPKVQAWINEYKEDMRLQTIRGHEAEIERRQIEVNKLKNIELLS